MYQQQVAVLDQKWGNAAPQWRVASHTELQAHLKQTAKAGGEGLSDAESENPPAVGTQVTYRYRGLNDSGVPRFALFWRARVD